MIVINSILEANDIFADVTPETLVVFDIDSVLQVPEDPTLHDCVFKKYREEYSEIVQNLTKDQLHILNHIIVAHGGGKLVEEIFPAIIGDLQARDIKTIAMTAAKTGRVSDRVPNFPEDRFDKLKKLGIDFSGTFPGKFYFNSLLDFHGDYPGIERGIVYSSGSRNSKGMLLGCLFDLLNWKPNKVILIDDKENNLLSFKEEIEKIGGIKYIGLHYKGADRLDDHVEVDVGEFKNLLLDLIKEVKI